MNSCCRRDDLKASCASGSTTAARRRPLAAGDDGGGAKRLLPGDLAAEISLDYDLGWCVECLNRGDHLKRSGERHCPHMPTGYDLVAWMAETGHWSHLPPTVHSGNVEGAAKMLGLIARQWRDPDGAPAPESPAAATPAVVRPMARAVSIRARSPPDHLPEMRARRPLPCTPAVESAARDQHGDAALSRALRGLRVGAVVKAPILVRLSPGADSKRSHRQRPAGTDRSRPGPDLSHSWRGAYGL